MKIAVIGYSGAGKSTMAKRLGEIYNCPVLHLDVVYHTFGWQVRPRQETLDIVQGFLDHYDEWIIDGTYSSLHFQRRLDEADRIIFLNFSRIFCLYSVIYRYLQICGKPRPDIAEGCKEKLDVKFLWAVASRKSVSHSKRNYQVIKSTYPNKFVELKNRKQVDAFLQRMVRER